MPNLVKSQRITCDDKRTVVCWPAPPLLKEALEFKRRLLSGKGLVVLHCLLYSLGHVRLCHGRTSVSWARASVFAVRDLHVNLFRFSINKVKRWRRDFWFPVTVSRMNDGITVGKTVGKKSWVRVR